MQARELSHAKERLAELGQPEADLMGPVVPAFNAVRGLVERLDARLALLGHLAQMPEAAAELLTGAVLQASFPVLVQYRRGHPERAASLLIGIWGEHARALDIATPDALAALTGAAAPRARSGAEARPAAVKEAATPAYVAGALGPPEEGAAMKATNGDGWECLVLFNTAVSDYLRLKRRGAEGRHILQRLMRTLDLSRDETGRMFGVTGETVRRWERGMVEVPAQQLAALTAADGALSRLLELFLPERLPLAIRRPAEAFGGERALDWILRGRIAHVAESYDRALMYQA